MKKLSSSLLIFIILALTVFGTGAGAVYNDRLENELYSDCALLLCTDNNEIIFSKNINKQTKPASLTKVVTALVVLSQCSNMDEVYTIPESCIRELDGTGSSLGGHKAGEQVRIYDLLCNMLIHSANEAATALATYVTGNDRQAFVDKMNALAQELGCTNSHFMNVHGLDDEDQYVSAMDMATFFKAAMENSVFAEIVAKSEYMMPETNMNKERKITTTNFTMMPGYKDYFCKYSTGGKTGTTSGAGHCLVSGASNNGYNYICVALNSVKEDLDGDNVDENGAFVDTKAMYDWAFTNLRLVPIASTAKIVGEVPVKYGKGTDYVTLCPGENAYGLMPRGVDENSVLIQVKEDTLPKSLSAPVKKGEKICRGQVYYANDVVSEIDLVASSEVKRSFISGILSAAERLVDSPYFRLLAVVIIAIPLLIIGLSFYARSKKRKKRGANR